MKLNFHPLSGQHPGRRSDCPGVAVFTRASGLVPGHGTQRQLLDGQSMPARPPERAQDVSFGGWNLATSPLPVEGHKGLRSSPMSETDSSFSSKINHQSLYAHNVKYLFSRYPTRGVSLLSNFINNRPSNVPGTARERLLNKKVAGTLRVATRLLPAAADNFILRLVK